MDRLGDSDELHRHQEAALAVLGRAAACLARGRDAVLDECLDLRAEVEAVLGSYQRFKHEHIFDPAIVSGEEQRMVLARHMKVACISGGELFRIHMQKWNRDRISAEWSDYAVAARLTVNQLRRHIRTEAEGIADLLAAYPAEPAHP